MSIAFPWCDECKNLVDDNTNYRCKAFPEGIPSEVLFDKDIKDKDECYNGYRFEKEKNK